MDINMDFVAIGGPIEMTTYLSPDETFLTVRPKSWFEYDGVFYLSPLPGDPNVLFTALSWHDLLDYFDYHPAGYLVDLDTEPYASEVRNGISWQIYRVEDGSTVYSFALSPRKNGGYFLIELETQDIYEDWVFDSVLMAAIKSFKVL